MIQQEFDLNEGRARRDEGMESVASHNEDFLAAARATAKRVALSRLDRTVTADDVRRHCPVKPDHPNAYGSIFRSKDFEFTGRFQNSKAVSRHAGAQRIWKLVG